MWRFLWRGAVVVGGIGYSRSLIIHASWTNKKVATIMKSLRGKYYSWKLMPLSLGLFSWIYYRASNFLFTLDLLIIYNRQNIQLSVSEILYWCIESFGSICRKFSFIIFPLRIIWRPESRSMLQFFWSSPEIKEIQICCVLFLMCALK